MGIAASLAASSVGEQHALPVAALPWPAAAWHVVAWPSAASSAVAWLAEPRWRRLCTLRLRYVCC